MTKMVAGDVYCEFFLLFFTVSDFSFLLNSFYFLIDGRVLLIYFPDYKVGSSQDMSDVYHFKQPDPSKELRAAIFGDLSVYKGMPTINQLIDATHNDHFDVIIHIGDIAYDLHDDEGDRGDAYMKAIQPFAAYVPYMVFAGNHESDTHFNQIVNRFTMPKNGVYDNNLFWSFDYGFVHFIALNSEYYAEKMTKEANAQYKWLQEDLAKNKLKWTIVMFHRP